MLNETVKRGALIESFVFVGNRLEIRLPTEQGNIGRYVQGFVQRLPDNVCKSCGVTFFLADLWLGPTATSCKFELVWFKTVAVPARQHCPRQFLHLEGQGVTMDGEPVLGLAIWLV